MKLIVGLGNVGPGYEGTPHNVGFAVLDSLLAQVDGADWSNDDKMKAVVWKGIVEGQDVLLAKPTTMMNLSGESVGRLAQFFKIAPEHIWIVYDELDLPIGRMKISTGGGNNGHNGLISVEQRLGHNRFWRFKVGVDGREDRQISGLEYVLRRYDEQQGELLLKSLNVVVEAIKTALKSSPVEAQTGYNGTKQVRERVVE